MHDHLGPTYRVARNAASELQNFDDWFSFLKAYFPDTLAGRHALGHIMLDVREILGCTCEDGRPWYPVSAKGNIRPCPCMARQAEDEALCT